ncbi:hypothetical protein [Streptomyces sp. NPDC004284]|uniref:hypothetical protein n=1 Tax=Streptomyces sp. NPDC004284 TaxID=3364695 RepID=UPI0036B03511
MKATMKKAAGLAAATVSALSISLVSAPAAHADSMFGCSYPYVCFYQGSLFDYSPTYMFKDVTSYWQNVRTLTGPDVTNTRNDDVVYLRTSNGTYCLPPNSSMGFPDFITVDGIRISYSSTC